MMLCLFNSVVLSVEVVKVSNSDYDLILKEVCIYLFLYENVALKHFIAICIGITQLFFIS